MRRMRYAAAVLVPLLLVIACSESQPPADMKADHEPAGSLVIEGELVGGGDETITLERAGTYVGFTFEEMATTRAEAGRFRFQTALQAPELLYLSVAERRGKIPLYVSNETIAVRLAADEETPSVVEGSALDTDFRAFQAALAEAEAVVEAAKARLEEAQETEDEDQITTAEAARDRAEAARKARLLAWVERTGSSTLGAYIGLRHLAMQMDVDELAPLLATLDPALAGSRYYDELDQRLQTLRTVAVGAPAPDISGPTRDEETIALSSLRGNVVLIDFWASWCVPCREQNSDLIALYEELHDDGFEILGVGLEFERDRWLDAMDTDELPWLNISDVTGFGMEAAQRFAIRSIPYNVLIDRQGTIIAKNLHGEALHQGIAEAL